jgi:hypothetical protein
MKTIYPKKGLNLRAILPCLFCGVLLLPLQAQTPNAPAPPDTLTENLTAQQLEQLLVKLESLKEHFNTMEKSLATIESSLKDAKASKNTKYLKNLNKELIEDTTKKADTIANLRTEKNKLQEKINQSKEDSVTLAQQMTTEQNKRNSLINYLVNSLNPSSDLKFVKELQQYPDWTASHAAVLTLYAQGISLKQQADTLYRNEFDRAKVVESQKKLQQFLNDNKNLLTTTAHSGLKKELEKYLDYLANYQAKLKEVNALVNEAISAYPEVKNDIRSRRNRIISNILYVDTDEIPLNCYLRRVMDEACSKAVNIIPASLRN